MQSWKRKFDRVFSSTSERPIRQQYSRLHNCPLNFVTDTCPQEEPLRKGKDKYYKTDTTNWRNFNERIRELQCWNRWIMKWMNAFSETNTNTTTTLAYWSIVHPKTEITLTIPIFVLFSFDRFDRIIGILKSRCIGAAPRYSNGANV